MREIKFRGWHTTQKKMYSAEEMAEDQLTLLPIGQFINVSGNSTKLSQIYPIDMFIPLQYTGLRDKNGREIYEGDVLEAWGKRFEVKWSADGAWNPFFDDCTRSYYYTIVGNIYEKGG